MEEKRITIIDGAKRVPAIGSSAFAFASSTGAAWAVPDSRHAQKCTPLECITMPFHPHAVPLPC